MIVMPILVQVPEGRSGCVVFKVDPLSSAANTLKVMDVVLEVEDVPIADDGTVQFRDDERVEFSHIVRSKHIGEQLQLRILRNGEIQEVRMSQDFCTGLYHLLMICSIVQCYSFPCSHILWTIAASTQLSDS